MFCASERVVVEDADVLGRLGMTKFGLAGAVDLWNNIAEMAFCSPSLSADSWAENKYCV